MSELESNLRRRLEAFEALEDASTWVANRANFRDRRMFDMESARLKRLFQIEGDRRPDIPSVLTEFETRRRVESISDLDRVSSRLIEQMEALLSNPEEFGIELVGELDEETILLPEQR